ncbi:hypothetical protein [Microcoleus sp. N3A4]|uniref:hypothetical protein n=1 Tax=Microcoleus sp. N3A4 TaxID=3055379 RepID=UPI00403F26AA
MNCRSTFFRSYIHLLPNFLWSEDGWKPLYWDAGMWETMGAVCRVSWYEAEVYACFVGMRLPAEAE